MEATINEKGLLASLETGRAQLKEILDAGEVKKTADGEETRNYTPAQLKEIQDRNAELNAWGEQLDTLRKGRANAEAKDDYREPIANRPGGDMGVSAKSGDELLVDAAKDLAKGLREGRGFTSKTVDFDPRELKTTVTTAAGFAPFVNRSGNVIDTVQVRPTLFDYLPIIPTTQNGYKFMQESTFTNNAGPKAEAAAYDEAALAWTEVTVVPERVGVHIPVTEEQLDDETGVEALIQRRLIEMVRIKGDAQALNGNGTSPQWEGILNLSGIQTQAKGGDPTFDAIFKAMVKVNTDAATTNGGANANLVVLNMSDYQDVVLSRTADGVYIYGDPQNAPAQRLWGVNVLLNSNLAAGTAVVMDTFYIQLLIRRGIEISMTNSHGTDFIGNVLRFKADMRGNVVAQREAAACKVTGL